jgi:hypothetical protein
MTTAAILLNLAMVSLVLAAVIGGMVVAYPVAAGTNEPIRARAGDAELSDPLIDLAA